MRYSDFNVPEKCLEFFLQNPEGVTPKALVRHVGTDGTPSKYVWYVKQQGYAVNTVKNGRKVIRYILVGKVPGKKGTSAVVKRKSEMPTFTAVVAESEANKKRVGRPVRSKVTPPAPNKKQQDVALALKAVVAE
jgi:hypothetical protein